MYVKSIFFMAHENFKLVWSNQIQKNNYNIITIELCYESLGTFWQECMEW